MNKRKYDNLPFEFYLRINDIDRRNVFDNEDIFTFEIRAFGRTVATKMFSGNWYPPKVRYDVDIRKLIPSIISTIQETLSEENLSKEYGGIAL